MNARSRTIPLLTGDRDYAGTDASISENGTFKPSRHVDLDRLSAAGIPVDIVFEQGANGAVNAAPDSARRLLALVERT
ncbi:MAG: hypothetical protein AAF465_10315 [Pseudomonadota bacterium]